MRKMLLSGGLLLYYRKNGLYAVVNDSLKAAKKINSKSKEDTIVWGKGKLAATCCDPRIIVVICTVIFNKRFLKLLSFSFNILLYLNNIINIEK